jgi:outer membrane lipoprotein SlyB
MSYDKGKTIRQYMGGGYMKPMQYQTGGSISPSIQNQLFDLRLARDVATAQQEQIEQAKDLEKQEKRRGLFGTLGSIGGTALGALAATALAGATGGLSLLAMPAVAKGLGSAAGSFAGEKLAEGITDTSGVGKRSSTGLLGSGFDRLKDINEEASEGALGRSLATGVKTGLMAGGADFLKNLGQGKDVLKASEGVGRQVQGLNLDTISGGETGGLGLSPLNTPMPSISSYYIPDASTSNTLLNTGTAVASDVTDDIAGVMDLIPNQSFFADDSIFSGQYGSFNMGGMVKKKKYGYEEGGEMKMYAGGGLINMLPFNRRIM